MEILWEIQWSSMKFSMKFNEDLRLWKTSQAGLGCRADQQLQDDGGDESLLLSGHLRTHEGCGGLAPSWSELKTFEGI